MELEKAIMILENIKMKHDYFDVVVERDRLKGGKQ